ncbi:MAG: MBL fold metallo-hydrolase [Actinobacteria bacterium RBG_19FT_COMBO_36_27]|nr:MAG: MBL fold metallo-hydrolase [Actinobacteria bacterium RBG_19FT_COMBO_36_27]
MQICIHRGSKQIGGSCVEVESHRKRLIIDLGLPLDAESNHDKYLPDIPGLDGNDNSLLAVIISHPHLDHFGLLTYINKKIPVIMGVEARNILKSASLFLPGYWNISAEGLNLKSEITFEIGPFKITPFLIDHSAYDAYSLLVEADGKKFFYSGDFRIHGRKAKMTERLISNPPQSIDVLLLEGSSLGRLENNEAFPSESEIEFQLVKTFSKTIGLILVHTSSQNIDRLVTVFRAAKKSGRRLLIDLYTAVILEATGNKNIPQSDWPEIALYIPQLQRIQIKKNKWFDLLKAHSMNRIFIENLKEVAAKSVMLFRPLHIRDLEKADCIKDAIYVYSQWEGYWEQDSYAYLRDWLIKNNIPKISIHTSGHASPGDLKRFVLALKPKKVVPIHTFNPERYSDLFENVEIHEDGKWWEV